MFLGRAPKPREAQLCVMATAFRVTTVTAAGNVGFPVHLDQIKGGATTRFANQRTILLGRVNVKVFANGNVQLAGLKDPDEVDGAMRALAARLLLAAGGGQQPSITARITMMNVVFSLGAPVCLHALHRALQHVTTCAFEPLLHPAARITHQAGAFKAFVFRSGHVMLFGCKTRSEARAAVDTITDWARLSGV